MTKFFKLVLIASTMIALTTGCKDNNGGGDPIKKMIPSEITYIESYGGHTFIDGSLISYDDRNRITKVESVSKDEVFHVKDFTYDGTGRLISITNYHPKGNSEYVMTFSYSGNSVIVAYDGEEEFAKFELQNNRLIKSYELFDDGKELISTISYDSRGNATKIVSDMGEMYISYENKRGVFSGVNMSSWFLVINQATGWNSLKFNNVNNPSTIKEVDENRTYLTTYHYEDYDNDYPTKIIVQEDEISLKQSKVFSFFNRKEKPTRSISGDEYSSHYEIKYIEAK